MTKKAKLAQFDAVEAERSLLTLAMFDLMCNSRFAFAHHVRVDCAKEVDCDFLAKYRVSISERAMPYYMVESFDDSGKVMSVQFHTEETLHSMRANGDVYWRMMRHAAWKIARLASPTMRNPELSLAPGF